MIPTKQDLEWRVPKPPSTCPKTVISRSPLLPPLSIELPRRNYTMTTMPVAPDVDGPDCVAAVKSAVVPKAFSWRTFGGDQVEKGGSRDQQLCGGCWAFAVASVLGDRVALRNQLQAPMLSTTWLISAGSDILQAMGQQPRPGCEGNNVYLAATWLGRTEIPIKLEACWPFKVIGDSQEFGGPGTQKVNNAPIMPTPEFLGDKYLQGCCFDCCGPKTRDLADVGIRCEPVRDDARMYTKYYGVDNEALDPSGNYTTAAIDLVIKDIQINLLTDGPMTTSINIYDDFRDYWLHQAPKGALYKRSSNALEGGHAVVIVGWGYDDKTKENYWEIRNSWGSGGWSSGYFKVPFSTLKNKNQWIGADVPIYKNGVYQGGAVSIIPKPIPDLDKILKTGLLKKSRSGDLLAKSRALIGGTGLKQLAKTCPNFHGYTIIPRRLSGSPRVHGVPDTPADDTPPDTPPSSPSNKKSMKPWVPIAIGAGVVLVLIIILLILVLHRN